MKAKRKKAVSRVPSWARAAALALNLMDPSREKRAPRARPSGEPTDIDLEDLLERDDAALLAHMRANGMESNVEREAGDRVLKKAYDIDEDTMLDYHRLAYLATRQTVGMPERAIVAAEKQAALMERSLFEINLGRRASYEMTQLAALARVQREQGHYT